MPRVRLRTVLLLLSLIAFALPFGGFFWLRVYDTQLVRQTELELLAQGAFVSALIDDALESIPSIPEGSPPLPEFTPSDSPFHPNAAKLDILREEVLPPAPDPGVSGDEPDQALVLAGEKLVPVLRAVKNSTLAGIRVVDTHGVVIASSNGETGGSLAQQNEVERALNGEVVSVLRRRMSNDATSPPLSSISRSTGLRVFVATPILHRGRVVGAVVLSRTPMTLGKAMYQDRVQLVATAALLLLSVVLVSFGAAYTVVRPMHALVTQARSLAEGQAKRIDEVETPITEEVAELSRALTNLASSLQIRGDYIRDFAAHVSHEFKTPLTAVRGALELLRDHHDTMTPTERARFLGNASEDVQRLERLVQKLLELARADMLKPQGDASADVADVARGLVTRAQHHDLALQTQGTAANPAIDGETLASILWSLVDNARLHAPGAAVTLIAADRDGRTTLTVSDDGPGVSPANASRIFTPFFTTARTQGSTGLGLTIARSLVMAHGGTLELLSTTRGASFEVTLPRR